MEPADGGSARRGLDVRTKISLSSVGALVEGNHGDPRSILGQHPVAVGGGEATAVRAFLPNSRRAWVVHPVDEKLHPMRRIHPAGVYEAICPRLPKGDATRYKLRFATDEGRMVTMDDPYSFPPVFSDYDLYLWGEGNLLHAYDRMGAQLRTIDGVSGVNFAVWAPNADSVSIVGDFNGWDGRRHPLQKHSHNGIWELFVPKLTAGQNYKYRIKRGHHYMDKCDPFGFSAEVPPKTASVISDIASYQWSDDEWMERRKQQTSLDRPISMYEVHLGSWRKPGDYRD